MKKSIKNNTLILIPVFNEGPVLGKVIKSIQAKGFDNILVVDDGSTDSTKKVAEKNNAFVVSHFLNRGAGAATQTGIDFAKEYQYEYLVIIDGDGQHHASDIINLLDKLIKTDSDMVIGNRFMNKENKFPNSRIIYNKIANLLTCLFCNNIYTDTQSGFRAFNRTALYQINIQNDGFEFCSDVIIMADKKGLKITEAPIKVTYNEYSLNKGQNLFMGIKTGIKLILGKLIKY